MGERENDDQVDKGKMKENKGIKRENSKMMNNRIEWRKVKEKEKWDKNENLKMIIKTMKWKDEKQ